MSDDVIKGWRGRQIVELAKREASPLVAKRCEEIVAAVKLNIGEAYPPASSPHKSPHARTGALQRSIDYHMVGDGEGVVTTDSPYALYLELGTRKMEPRPFFRKAILGVRHLFSKIDIHR